MILDKDTILQVLGSLMKKPQFLSETDKYTLTPSDFPTRFHRNIFIAIFNLYQQGAQKIAPIDVNNYLKLDGTGFKSFEQENGVEYLQDAEYLSDERTFPYYYTKLKKCNLLENFKKSGIDISSFYCEDTIKPEALEINRRFEELTIQDIVDQIKKTVYGIEKQFIQNDTTETISAADGIEEIVAEGESGADIGLPLQGEIFNEVVSGARKGTFVVRSAGSGTGKALPNSTIIPTLIGPRAVGDIRVGDYLFDAFGKPTKVLGVYPQGFKEVYYVKFKDGRTARCCNEHLWSYCTPGQKEASRAARKFYTHTLEELQQQQLQDSDGGYKILVPMNYAVEYPEQQHYIPSYVFGLILGDGSFRYQDTNRGFSYSSEDEYLPQMIASAMGWVLKRGSSANYNWYFADPARIEANDRHVNIWVEELLKEHPELIQCKSEDKFIPECYLYDSVANRLDLLNGLLDSDGSVDEKGRINYFTISPHLRDNVVDLCHSLGFKANVSVDAHKSTNIGYVVHIAGRPKDKEKLFKLPRKRQRLLNWLNSNQRKETNEFNPIVEIGSCGYFEEMTCFYVDNNEHLFLMNDYIVTHNTRNAVGDGCLLAFPIRYDEISDKWVQTGNNQKVLFIATEQSPKEIQRMILAYLTGFNESKFRYGQFTEAEQRVVRQAVWVMNTYKENFFIVRMPNPSIELVKTIVRENCLLHGVEYVFYDYIFVGPSLINEFRGVNLRNDEILLMFSTALKDLAVEQNIFVMTSTQVNANADNNKDIRNESSIAGSRAVVNKADIGCVMARPTNEELDVLKQAGVMQYGMPNLVTDMYKVRSGEWTQVRIWSNMDLGNLRKTDLFVTDSRLTPIQNFAVNMPIIEWDDEQQDELNQVINALETADWS